MSGAEKTPTWTRLGTEPRAGDTTLTVAQPVSGWRAGDGLILPDSRHLHWNEVTGWARTSPQWEELALSAISADGRVLTLSAALRFNHPGARDGATGNGTLRWLPHVGNLTRNVIVRSQSPIGGGGTQGHTLFMERADVDIRYTAFRDLGRTQIRNSTNDGRYPIYFEDLIGPATTPANGYQYTFVGNAVDGGSSAHSRRWAISLDDSHYGLIADNVLYNYAGALVMTEAGSESYNVFARNFLMRSTGTGGRLGMGDEGQGFWFRGTNNYVRGNVTANFDSDEPEASYGYKYFMRTLGTVRIPTAKGQDSAAYVAVDGNNLPILEFSDNEVYGAAQGLTYWWLSSLVNGVINGVRFYKGTTNTGTHVAHLWSATGTLLATATFINETASGWQQVTFATPVAITANTTYIASYHTDAGNYALNGGYFLAGGVDRPPLHALGNGVDGPNAVFVYGATAFPRQTSNGNNYWVDVVFTPQ